MKNIILCVLMLAGWSQAQIIDVNFNGGGTTSYSAWSNVNAFNYSGYGSFPGNAPWPSPIAANQGSSIPTMNRVSGSPTGGGPYPASDSIYFGNFAQVPNALGGTLRLSNSAPLFNLKTLVFQIQIGEATGFDFFQPTGFPKISINGGSYSFSTYTNLVNRYQNGTFPSPETDEDEPVYVNTWAYQWNFSDSPINSYAIDFSGVTHSQIYALRLDGTSVLQNNQVIPEPSTYALIIVATLGIFLFKVLKNYKRDI
jgi:hypothetical protein